MEQARKSKSLGWGRSMEVGAGPRPSSTGRRELRSWGGDLINRRGRTLGAPGGGNHQAELHPSHSRRRPAFLAASASRPRDAPRVKRNVAGSLKGTSRRVGWESGPDPYDTLGGRRSFWFDGHAIVFAMPRSAGRGFRQYSAEAGCQGAEYGIRVTGQKPAVFPSRASPRTQNVERKG